MTIKAIVTDMDGTFLKDDKTYDRDYFLAIKEEMTRQGMHFVVASGNQYWRLVDYFPDFGEQLFYIADNGADIRYHGEQLAVQTIAPQFHQPILRYLTKELPEHHLVVSGGKGVYISEKSPQAMAEHVAFFYRQIHQVDLTQPIRDDVFKFALNFPASLLDQATHLLTQEFGQQLTVVTSGHEAVDIMSNRAGKEVGIQALMNQFQLAPEEIAVFGDNRNDLGMFQLAGHAYATANALEEVKEAANTVIGTNNDQAVLQTIETFL